ncbi:hypothetical protein H312_01635 [Anncaliia algerae PRA339]|uniref:Uncharacterized protein n=1 Tax=Anncaliia algerae PRA339 TaxID=1288291 RepID=A0A059F1R4_9MICR|nr:hypothetical protein H312_01631 [Anncaliia algerae PRA339]KCZ80948.1 hypothetical protein H312_01635 [Anncaliia algerae PRA339]
MFVPHLDAFPSNFQICIYFYNHLFVDFKIFNKALCLFFLAPQNKSEKYQLAEACIYKMDRDISNFDYLKSHIIRYTVPAILDTNVISVCGSFHRIQFIHFILRHSSRNYLTI